MTRELLAARVRSVSYIGEMDAGRAAGPRRPRARARRGPARRVPDAVHDDDLVGELQPRADRVVGAARPPRPAVASHAPTRGRVLVSELMLQQTQVPRVVPRYEAFLERFPTPAACAAAPVGDVVRAWEGLGYNRRAVNLHRCATAVRRAPRRPAARHARTSCSPSPASGRTRPGPCSCSPTRTTSASSTRTPAASSPAPSPAAPLAADGGAGDRRRRRARRATPGGGARRCSTSAPLVCTKRSPRCDACPLRDAGCAWAAAGFPEPDPVARLGRHLGAAVALRRQRPPGPRPPRRRAARARRGAGPRRGDGLARRPRARRPGGATVVADGLAVVDGDEWSPRMRPPNPKLWRRGGTGRGVAELAADRHGIPRPPPCSRSSTSSRCTQWLASRRDRPACSVVQLRATSRWFADRSPILSRPGCAEAGMTAEDVAEPGGLAALARSASHRGAAPRRRGSSSTNVLRGARGRGSARSPQGRTGRAQ